MISRRSFTIVNISSVAASVCLGAHAAYVFSEAVLNQVTRRMNSESRKYNIRGNGVVRKVVLTEIVKKGVGI